MLTPCCRQEMHEENSLSPTQTTPAELMAAANERPSPFQSFEADRERLRKIAYRLLGSASDADDAVQEAWLRLRSVDADEVNNLHGWMTTVVSRIALDMLRARKTRREEPLVVEAVEPILNRE